MKKVLITGASSGIGYSLAEIYAENGYYLILVARREKELGLLKEKLEKEYRVKVEVEVMDLAIKENVKILWEKYKDIDILINNAGFGIYSKFVEYEIEKDFDMINLNISSLVYLTKLYGNSMKRGDKIINIGSTAGFQPVPFMGVYGASKSFVVDFTLAIAQEIKNIDIVLFCPGETQTEFQKVANRPKSSVLRGKIPSSDEVAKYLFDESDKGKTFIIWGKYNKILLFFQKFLSKEISAKIIYKTQER